MDESAAVVPAFTNPGRMYLEYDALVFGLLEAIIINHIEYLTRDDRRSGHRSKKSDGRYWISKTIPQWVGTLRTFGRTSIIAAINHCEELGVVLSKRAEGPTSPKRYAVDRNRANQLIWKWILQHEGDDDELPETDDSTEGGYCQNPTGVLSESDTLKTVGIRQTYKEKLINKNPEQGRGLSSNEPNASATTTLDALNHENNGVVAPVADNSSDFGSNADSPPVDVDLAPGAKFWKCPACGTTSKFDKNTLFCDPDHNGCGQRVAFVIGDRRIEAKAAKKIVEPRTSAALYLRELSSNQDHWRRWTSFASENERNDWEAGEKKVGAAEMRAMVDWAVGRTKMKASAYAGSIKRMVDDGKVFLKSTINNASPIQPHYDNSPIQGSVRPAMYLNPLRRAELEADIEFGTEAEAMAARKTLSQYTALANNHGHE